MGRHLRVFAQTAKIEREGRQRYVWRLLLGARVVAKGRSRTLDGAIAAANRCHMDAAQQVSDRYDLAALTIER